MTTPAPGNDQTGSLTRRAALKALAAATGSVALTSLPAFWRTPSVRVGALPALAQISPLPTATSTATSPAPTGTNTPTSTGTPIPSSTTTDTPTPTATATDTPTLTPLPPPQLANLSLELAPECPGGVVLTVGCAYTNAVTGSSTFTIELNPANLGKAIESPVLVPWDLTESSGNFSTDLCVPDFGPWDVSVQLTDGAGRMSNTLSGQTQPQQF